MISKAMGAKEDATEEPLSTSEAASDEDSDDMLLPGVLLQRRACTGSAGATSAPSHARKTAKQCGQHQLKLSGCELSCLVARSMLAVITVVHLSFAAPLMY